MEKTRQQVRSGARTQLVEQVNSYLRSGDYSRSLDLLRDTDAEFPDDAELSELEKRAHDGVKRKADADRLITESQELFAQRKSAEAIQLLRQAYELDKSNSLARAILANALVEHAHSVVETDWLKAETLTNQALALNPAHPTAKAVLNLIVERKQTSSVDDWVAQARKLQSSGDLFGALAWVAEGLAVHPHDPKLLQIQDAIQRDQDARRRQARRGDLDELRRLQREIDGAADVAAKQALAERIQSIAAKHWTDGEILSIANALLLRLGLVSQESSNTSPRGKGATVILHVPRPGTATPASVEASPIPAVEIQPPPAVTKQATAVAVAQKVSAIPVTPPQVAPTQVVPTEAPLEEAPQDLVATNEAPPSPVVASPVLESPAPASAAPSVEPPVVVAPPIKAPLRKVPASNIPLRTPVRGKPRPTLPKAPTPASQAAATAAVEAPALVAKVAKSSQSRQPAKSNSAMLILVASAAAIILVGAIFFFAQKHQTSPVTTTPAATASEPTPPAPTVSAPEASAPAPTNPEPPQPVPSVSPNATAGNATPDFAPPADVGRNAGTLVVVAGQDGARVALNGKLLRQLTQGGQVLVPNLLPKDYVVQVAKSGFQDPPQQTVHIRKGEEARLTFNLQPQPSLASLTIQGAAPGTTVLVDQAAVGTVQADGTLSVSTVNPGDHTVELRKDRFKPRQFKKHFVAGAAVSLVASDAALEAAPALVKITFAPADAKVAIVKGEQLTVVNSGVPINLPAGSYTLTARTSDRFTRWSTLEVAAGESKTLDLSLTPNGMSKWDDPSAWKAEKDGFTRKGGDFVLYGVSPAGGTFAFSAMVTKGHLLQWVVNFTDPQNYVLFQMDDNNFYRTVIRNGQKTDEVKVPDKGDKKSFRTFQIRVSPTEIVHEVKHGDRWTVVDRWTHYGANLSLGKFGFYIPADDQIALSGFAQYADINTH